MGLEGLDLLLEAKAHTGLPVAVFAQGAGQELFKGFYDNTEIYNKMASLLNVK